MSTCISWKMVDSKHWRGLCTNEFKLTTPPSGVVSNTCSVCAGSQEVGTDECGCELDNPAKQLYYGQASVVSGSSPTGCFATQFFKPFVLIRNNPRFPSYVSSCQWSDDDKAIQSNGSTVCAAASASNPPPQWFMTSTSVVTPFQVYNCTLTFRYYFYLGFGSPTFTDYRVFTGPVKWCQNKGLSTLTYSDGFGSMKVVLSHVP